MCSVGVLIGCRLFPGCLGHVPVRVLFRLHRDVICHLFQGVDLASCNRDVNIALNTDRVDEMCVENEKSARHMVGKSDAALLCHVSEIQRAIVVGADFEIVSEEPAAERRPARGASHALLMGFSPSIRRGP